MGRKGRNILKVYRDHRLARIKTKIKISYLVAK